MSTLTNAAWTGRVGHRARAAALANLGGALGTVWATFAAPGSILLTLFVSEWLGADKWQIGLILAITHLGPTLEPVGAWLSERFASRRRSKRERIRCSR